MPDSMERAQRTDRFDLRALYETSRLLSSSLDLTFVLNNLLLTAMSKLLVPCGVVLLYDPLEDAYRVSVSKGGTGFQAEDTVHLDGLPSDGVLQGEEIPEVLGEHRIHLALPIAAGDRKIGLIGLGKKATGQPYGAQELEFIQSLVNMSSAAVHNSLMVEELKQANYDLDNKIQQLNTLFDLSQEFNATIEREQLVKLLSFALMGQMLVGKYLLLFRRQGGGNEEGEQAKEFRVVADKGIRDTTLEPDLIARLSGREDLLLLQNSQEEDNWEGLTQRGLVLALPLRQHGETHGVLCLGPKMTGQPYKPDDLEFLYALGNLALVSIQNSFLVDEQIEKERLEKEMRLARGIQERLLPQELPSLPGVEVAAVALPSRHVGGDYYDVVKLDDDRMLLAIADVTGKGVPASLLMANIQAGLHVILPMDISIEEATLHLNRIICENTGYDKFITFFHGIYDARDRSFEYVNAGHNPPVLMRANGDMELLEKGGLLLGIMKSVTYERGRVTLDPGDVIAIFTDGVTEAMSPENEEYGEERLEACLSAYHHEPAQAILDAVRQDIRTFTHDPTLLSDDLTMIVFKVKD